MSPKLDVAERALARNLSWIGAADSKIPAVFAVDTAMLGVMAAVVPSEMSRAGTVVVAIALAAAALLLVSVVMLAVAAFPRLAGPKGSVVYFGGVVALPEQEYVERITNGPTAALLKDVAQQAYRNAEIASHKYRAVTWAMRLLFAGMLPWLAAIALVYGVSNATQGG